MPLSELDLVIEQGATFSHGWAVSYAGTPLDESWSAASQVRSEPGAVSTLGEFTAAVNPDGSVVIGASAAVTQGWTWGTGVYDVEVSKTIGGAPVVLRVAAGSVFLSPEVTR